MSYTLKLSKKQSLTNALLLLQNGEDLFSMVDSKCSDILSLWNTFILAAKQMEISDCSNKLMSTNM